MPFRHDSLEQSITQQGFRFLLTVQKSPCLLLSTAESTNSLTKEYRKGEDSPGQQQVNGFKSKISHCSSPTHPCHAQQKRAPATTFLIFCPNLFIACLYTFSLTSIWLLNINNPSPLSKTQREYVYSGSFLMVNKPFPLFYLSCNRVCPPL